MKKGLIFLHGEPEKWFPLVSEYTLRGFNLTKVDEAWRLVIKVTDRRGNKMVAFITAPNPYDCFWYLHQAHTKTNAPLKYRTDRYAK